VPSAPALFDSHCHFDFSAFDPDRDAVWQACKDIGIDGLVIPGVAPEQWLVAAQLSQQNGGIFYAAGIHPWWVEQVVADDTGPDNLERLRGDLQNQLSADACVAVGECGLDKMIDVDFDLQQRVFELQVNLATELSLPLIVHCRKAHNEVLALLRRYRPARGGVIHGFSGSAELANDYWALGFYLGIGGTITYERAQKTRAAVKQLPLEAILLETDAPDMPLSGRQGERNSPQYLPEIARTLAEIRAVSVDEIARQTTRNARTLFALN
jgi:TatD DNase family protein